MYLHACPRCPSGGFSRDMTHGELHRHLADQHNAVFRVKCTTPNGTLDGPCALETAAIKPEVSASHV